jgi:hypothetical protein
MPLEDVFESDHGDCIFIQYYASGKGAMMIFKEMVMDASRSFPGASNGGDRGR